MSGNDEELWKWSSKAFK